MLDLVRWSLGLSWPKRISSSGGILVQQQAKANTTDTQTATFEFDDLNVCWTHRSWGDPPDPEFPWGATIYGSQGTLKMSVQKYEFTPRGRGQRLSGQAVIEADKYPRDLDDQKKWNLELPVASAIRGHMRNFLDCIDSRKRPVADIEEGHISSASCILANNALTLGRTIQWDAEQHRAVGDEQANALLLRPYREPWVHPANT
jgi:predicted dehydrogenase